MNTMSSLQINTEDRKVVTTKSGGIIKTILFIVALILILGYFGITFTDVQNNRFVQFLVELFTNFFRN